MCVCVVCMYVVCTVCVMYVVCTGCVMYVVGMVCGVCVCCSASQSQAGLHLRNITFPGPPATPLP